MPYTITIENKDAQNSFCRFSDVNPEVASEVIKILMESQDVGEPEKSPKERINEIARAVNEFSKKNGMKI